MDKITTFFEKLQDRYLVVFCFLVSLGLYLYKPNDAVLQLMINFGVAIIAFSKGKAQSLGQTETGDVNLGKEK